MADVLLAAVCVCRMLGVAVVPTDSTHVNAHGGDIRFVTVVQPETVYVGEQLSYTALLRVATNPAPRFLEPPRYTPPLVAGAIRYASPFDSAKSVHTVREGGRSFTEYRYRQAIVPVTSGVDTLMSSVRFTLVNEADPYASTETVLRGPAHIVVVRALPTAGRPATFSGAVGRLTVTMSVDSQHHWTVGTGRIVRATIAGTGNLSLVSRPVLPIPWANVAPVSDTTVLDSAEALIGGRREFTWLVTPQRGGAQSIPALQYSYFDPESSQYAAAQSVAIPVNVDGGARDPHADSLATTPVSALAQLRYGKAIVATIIATIALIVSAVFVARRRRHAMRTIDDA